jgi:hypothetical protein
MLQQYKIKLNFAHRTFAWGIVYGSKPADGGGLLFDNLEKEKLIKSNPELGEFIAQC